MTDWAPIIIKLDWHVRILNPGLHYVYRKTYMGYRREASETTIPQSKRTQVFLCVAPRTEIVQVILPIDPAPFAKVANTRVLTDQGYHGVGNLQIDLVDDSTLVEFLRTFDFWLRAR